MNIMLKIGLGMLVGYIVFKIYKMIKYSVRVEAEIVRHNDDYYRAITPNDTMNRYTAVRAPIYRYSYKGMIYYHRSSFGVGGKEGHKRITRKIRINPRKPNKAYVAYARTTVAYLFFNLIVLTMGIFIFIGETLYR